VLGGILIAVVGGFVLWLQAGLLYAVASLAYGGYGLQAHLTAAADGVKSGEYDQARTEYERARSSTNSSTARSTRRRSTSWGTSPASVWP
jgi:hypothetical protein